MNKKEKYVISCQEIPKGALRVDHNEYCYYKMKILFQTQSPALTILSGFSAAIF